jgi:cytosine deaminase
MAHGFITVPVGGSLRLSRAKVPSCLLDEAAAADADGLATVDIDLHDGRILAVGEALPAAAGATVDMGLRQVWPAFVDVHTHLDKGHILPRASNPDGTVLGAVRSVGSDRTNHWSAADVRARFEYGLKCAYAHGTAAMRTHLDCEPPQAAITWPVLAEMRDKWAGRIDLQGVGKFPLELYLEEAGERFAAMVADHGGALGAITRVAGLDPASAAPVIDAALDALFRLAKAHGLGVDLHVDESGDPSASTLRQVALAAIRAQFSGGLVCGHCCSLAVQPAGEAAETMRLCAAAGIAVVTLPMINQYLQARVPGATPRWRGVTLVHELAGRGIPVAVASDNCRDPFFAFGDHDMLEVLGQSVRIAHLDKPYGSWPGAAARVPAAMMGLTGRGVVRKGAPADLVLFRARTMSELLSRPQSDRVVLRAGVPIDATLPDYAELDPLFTA